MRLVRIEDTRGEIVLINPELVASVYTTEAADTAISLMGQLNYLVFTKLSIDEVECRLTGITTMEIKDEA